MDEVKRNIKLLPCPFCGEQPNLYNMQNDFVDNEEYFVRCDNEECGCELNDFYSLKVAIEKWNTRNG